MNLPKQHGGNNGGNNGGDYDDDRARQRQSHSSPSRQHRQGPLPLPTALPIKRSGQIRHTLKTHTRLTTNTAAITTIKNTVKFGEGWETAAG
mmetsp:Transcript_1475/g.3150  ORF Transcript_1475/g.3150 Transcript_1475/m.3150 type:complete len:92 (+) Transcript_1475:316-591(+)